MTLEACLTPIVRMQDGKAFATSIDIASSFGKEHRNILRAIDDLIAAAPELGAGNATKGGLLNFEHTPYVGEQNGQTYRQYKISRDGFALLVMGFTGERALKWKLRYIEAFNAMEAQLRGPAVDLDVRDPVALGALMVKLVAFQQETERRALIAEAKVEAAKPKTEFYDQFANAEGLFGLQNAARVLGESPNKFIGHLKREYLFYQGKSLVPYRRYIEKGLFEVKCLMVGDIATWQTFVTPRGIQYFVDKLGKSDLLSRVA